MKIIKNGSNYKQPTNRVHKKECIKCGCQYEYSDPEIHVYKMYRKQPSGHTGYWDPPKQLRPFIHCPQCDILTSHYNASETYTNSDLNGFHDIYYFHREYIKIWDI